MLQPTLMLFKGLCGGAKDTYVVWHVKFVILLVKDTPPWAWSFVSNGRLEDLGLCSVPQSPLERHT